MKRTVGFFGLSICAGALLSAGGVLFLTRTFAQADRPARESANPSPPTSSTVVSAETPVVLAPYVSKYAIEKPTEKLLAAKTAPTSAAPAVDTFVNPKVQPGKVRWHTDFAAACRAAQKSGKPVLLFQMMGKLDDRFC